MTKKYRRLIETFQDTDDGYLAMLQILTGTGLNFVIDFARRKSN
ncbi:MAG TPA: hypothetical protein VJZ03_01260 [Candidatus Bathyarchaeia archaeon]|nr:hypothetical protein [Candidatus Bathyarchaeia archaeon]